MAAFLDKVKVNSAVTKRTKIDFSHQHITTADFFQLAPICVKELVPSERVELNIEALSRANAMPVPTFGRGNLKISSFAVPLRTIFPSFNSFITDSVRIPSSLNLVDYSSPTTVPYILNSVFVNAFLYDYVSNPYAEEDPDKAYEAGMQSDSLLMNVGDYSPQSLDTAFDVLMSGVPGATGSQMFVFTIKGRQAIKVLESLGYKILWALPKQGQPEPRYSALPLLALARIYADWFAPAQYSYSADYAYLLQLCSYNVGTDGVVQLSYGDVLEILKYVCYSNYDADYFVSAFDEPVSPVIGNHSLISIPDITNPGTGNLGGVVDNALSNGTPVIHNSGSNSASSVVSNLTQFALTALRSLNDFVERNRIAGSKAYQRYLLRFGKALSDEQLNQSVYIGSSSQGLQIGDVTSTSDTEGANLGSFAGKGMIYGNNHFEYESNEFCYFVSLASIIPAIGYPEGVDRSLVGHLTKTDFFTPEFDNLSVQAVASEELYVPQNVADHPDSWLAMQDSHFGFLPRYAEIKCPKDYLTGNFRLPSINGANSTTGVVFNAANSWNLFRLFSRDDFDVPADIHHSFEFVHGRFDKDQYKRIFYNVNPSSPDNFTIIYNFDMVAYAPYKSLFNTYEFEDKGDKVTIQANGVKVN